MALSPVTHTRTFPHPRSANLESQNSWFTPFTCLELKEVSVLGTATLSSPRSSGPGPAWEGKGKARTAQAFQGIFMPFNCTHHLCTSPSPLWCSAEMERRGQPCLLLSGSSRFQAAQGLGWRGEGFKGGGTSRVSSVGLTVLSLPLKHLRDTVCVWWEVLSY